MFILSNRKRTVSKEVRMSKKIVNKDTALFNDLQKKAITDLAKQLQPRLSRLKEQPEPPRKPSEDELRLLEWNSRPIVQARSSSHFSGDPTSFHSLTTTHHSLAGLSIEEDPPEWEKEPSSCSFFPKVIRWAKAEDAALGIGAAVGDFYGCTYTGGTAQGLEINSAWSAFRFDHQLLPTSEGQIRYPSGYRLRLTVKLEIPIPGNLWNFMGLMPKGQDDLVGVKGEITIFLYATAAMVKTVPFLMAKREGLYSGTQLDYNPFVFAQAEISTPSDFTSYHAVIAARVMAFRNKNGAGFAAINLAGPDAGMWWLHPNGAGPIIVHYVKTELRLEPQVIAHP